MVLDQCTYIFFDVLCSDGLIGSVSGVEGAEHQSAKPIEHH